MMMKYYTEGLINDKRKFSLIPGRKSKYYIAYGNDSGRILMWIEEKYTNRMRTFPCLIKDGDGLQSYAQKYVPDSESNNERLVARWNELINAETVHSEYTVEPLNEKEFFTKYQALKNGAESIE